MQNVQKSIYNPALIIDFPNKDEVKEFSFLRNVIANKQGCKPLPNYPYETFLCNKQCKGLFVIKYKEILYKWIKENRPLDYRKPMAYFGESKKVQVQFEMILENEENKILPVFASIKVLEQNKICYNFNITLNQNSCNGLSIKILPETFADYENEVLNLTVGKESYQVSMILIK